MAGVALLVLLAAGGLTLLDRLNHSRVLARETEQSAVPTVAVVHPLAEKPDVELVLPGSLLAFKESPIYARTNGYLLRWYKDIGSRVKKGELLAQIDTPEVDQELNQARAARQQMQAQMELAKITADALGEPAQDRLGFRPGGRPAEQRLHRRARPTWPPPTPTCAAWKSSNRSRTSTRRSPACSPNATSIPAR